MSEVRASIDIGSNSLLLLIAEVDQSKIISEISSKIKITSLGHEVDKTHQFAEKSMAATKVAFKEFYDEILKFDLDPKQTIVTATEASRVAFNADEFYAKVKADFGFEVQIITSTAEAYYTALGVSLAFASLNPTIADLTIMDIGGASTEIIRVQLNPFHVNASVSLPVGSVRASEWIKQGDFVHRLDLLLSQVNVSKYIAEDILCVAGTMVSIGRMIEGLTDYDADLVNKINVKFEFFGTFLDKIKECSPQKLLTQYPFLKERSETIIGGARTAKAIGIKLKAKSISLSTFGLRHGTLFEGCINDHNKKQ